MSESHTRTDATAHFTTDDATEIQSMHDVFSSWERRAILYYLQEREAAASVADLAEHLVAWRRGTDQPAAGAGDVVERVRHRIVHAHVMEMAEFGVLRYDARSERVELSEGMRVTVCPPWHRDSDRPGQGE